MRLTVKTCLLLTLLATLLTGCGFHLRGQTSIPDTMQHLTIVCGDAVDPRFCARVSQRLQKAGYPPVAADAAQIFLHIDALRDESRAISVNRNAVAAEYEQLYHLDFHLTLRDGIALIPADKIKVARTYRFDENQVLSKTREKEGLRTEVYRELTDNLIRRLKPFHKARIKEIRHKHGDDKDVDHNETGAPVNENQT